MSREIKFRAWDEEEEVMNDEPIIHDGKWYDTFISFDADEPRTGAVMQYTGLKDKNGKEIYEGDLIELKIDFGYGPQPVIARVIWEGEGWQFDSEAGCAYGSDAVGEVIGNIYENPELLEQSAA